MPRLTKAELFISTLAEFLRTERQSRNARRRLKHKAHAQRFIQAFPAEFDESRNLSEWKPSHGQPWQEAVSQIQAE